jgi:hypothetical protein
MYATYMHLWVAFEGLKLISIILKFLFVYEITPRYALEIYLVGVV